MQPFHILNGDSLKNQMKTVSLPGEILICREAMVEGPKEAQDPEEFWKDRAAYLDEIYGDSGSFYMGKVIPEFEKMVKAPVGAEVVLWFEDDLFCQANMWFCLHWLSARSDLKVFRVFPAPVGAELRWRGFGANSPDQLKEAYENRILLTEEDRELGADLWRAFLTEDISAMKALAITSTEAFCDLPEVVKAWEGYPGKIESFIQQKLQAGATGFGEIFRAFCRECGIYGFGDLQVKRIYDSLVA